jgi:hypothetical protein
MTGCHHFYVCTSCGHAAGTPEKPVEVVNVPANEKVAPDPVEEKPAIPTMMDPLYENLQAEPIISDQATPAVTYVVDDIELTGHMLNFAINAGKPVADFAELATFLYRMSADERRGFFEGAAAWDGVTQ